MRGRGGRERELTGSGADDLPFGVAEAELHPGGRPRVRRLSDTSDDALVAQSMITPTRTGTGAATVCAVATRSEPAGYCPTSAATRSRGA